MFRGHTSGEGCGEEHDLRNSLGGAHPMMRARAGDLMSTPGTSGQHLGGPAPSPGSRRVGCFHRDRQRAGRKRAAPLPARQPDPRRQRQTRTRRCPWAPRPGLEEPKPRAEPVLWRPCWALGRGRRGSCHPGHHQCVRELLVLLAPGGLGCCCCVYEQDETSTVQEPTGGQGMDAWSLPQ